MDGEESLQCEFDGRSENGAGIAAAAERARLQHFTVLKSSGRLHPLSFSNCNARKFLLCEQLLRSSRGDGH